MSSAPSINLLKEFFRQDVLSICNELSISFDFNLLNRTYKVVVVGDWDSSNEFVDWFCGYGVAAKDDAGQSQFLVLGPDGSDFDQEIVALLREATGDPSAVVTKALEPTDDREPITLIRAPLIAGPAPAEWEADDAGAAIEKLAAQLRLDPRFEAALERAFEQQDPAGLRAVGGEQFALALQSAVPSLLTPAEVGRPPPRRSARGRRGRLRRPPVIYRPVHPTVINRLGVINRLTASSSRRGRLLRTSGPPFSRPAGPQRAARPGEQRRVLNASRARAPPQSSALPRAAARFFGQSVDRRPRDQPVGPTVMNRLFNRLINGLINRFINGLIYQSTVIHRPINRSIRP